MRQGKGRRNFFLSSFALFVLFYYLQSYLKYKTLLFTIHIMVFNHIFRGDNPQIGGGGKLFKIKFYLLFVCKIYERIHSIVMFLNRKFIRCYIKSMFDYFLGTQKAPISWNDPYIFLVHAFPWDRTLDLMVANRILYC